MDLDIGTVNNIETLKIRKMLDYIGTKTFLKHQSQGFEHFVLLKACNAEKAVFPNTVKIVPRGDVSKGANVIYIHAL